MGEKWRRQLEGRSEFGEDLSHKDICLGKENKYKKKERRRGGKLTKIKSRWGIFFVIDCKSISIFIFCFLFFF